jgi:hypothetical protein
MVRCSLLRRPPPLDLAIWGKICAPSGVHLGVAAALGAGAAEQSSVANH